MVVSGEVYKQRTCISKINYCRTESKSEKVKNNGNTCIVGTRGISNASWLFTYENHHWAYLYCFK